MQRRTFLGMLAGGLLVAPRAARSQPVGEIYRIGYLRSTNSPALRKSFLAGLHDLGYIEGRNFVVEYRFSDGRSDRFPRLAAELVQANVHVIVTSGTPATLAAKQATQTIPIVFASAGEVVLKGIVESLARPGGNATGLQIQVGWAKGLQLLREAAPKTTRVVYLHDPATYTAATLQDVLDQLRAAAQAQNVALQLVALTDPNAVEQAFARFGRGTNGLIVEPAPALVFKAEQIAKLALQRRLPSTGYGRVFADAGCLMSYGEDLADMYRRAAVYVDKILKGAKPGDLPVEQPTKLDLVINLKTAKALGLTVPPPLVLQANHVIQ